MASIPDLSDGIENRLHGEFDRSRITYMFNLLNQQAKDIRMLNQDISGEMSSLGHILNQKVMKIDRIISYSYVSLSKRLPDHSYFHCSVCNDTFDRAEDLMKHKSTATCWSQFEELMELKQKLFVCRMCDSIFMDFKAMIIHIVTELLIHGFTIPTNNLDLNQCITIIYIEQLYTENINHTLSKMKRLLTGEKDPIFDEIDKLEAQIDEEQQDAVSHKAPVKRKSSEDSTEVSSKFSRVQKARGSLVSALVKKKQQELSKKDIKELLVNDGDSVLNKDNVIIKQEIVEHEVDINESKIKTEGPKKIEAHSPIVKMPITKNKGKNGQLGMKRGPYKKKGETPEKNCAKTEIPKKESKTPTSKPPKKSPPPQPLPSRVSKRQRVPNRKFFDTIDPDKMQIEDEKNEEEEDETMEEENFEGMIETTYDDEDEDFEKRSNSSPNFICDDEPLESSSTGPRSHYEKAEAERARRMAETDLFMELRVLKLDGGNDITSFDTSENKLKLLKWATKEAEILNDEHSKLNRTLHMEKSRNMKLTQQIEAFKKHMELLKRPSPIKMKIANGKSSII